MATRYLITGGTGFIGRRLVAHLRERNPGDLVLLVRPASLAQPVEGARVIRGDVTLPGLGLSQQAAEQLPAFDHVFHLAACYDLEADKEDLNRANVDGTRNLLGFLRERQFTGVLHHVSSVAVAGDLEGTLFERDLDVGQKHPHPYHRSKFESERLVRDAEDLRTRIYRPSAVVGDSQTGAMERVDGPYFLFKVVHKLRNALPRWFPLWGYSDDPINMVPVDFVAAGIDHIAHAADGDGETFHLVDPDPPRFRETYNLVADAAAAPRMTRSLGRLLARRIPSTWKVAGQLASVKFLRDQVLADFGIPPQLLSASNRKTSFDCANTNRALADSSVRCPPQRDYVEVLWDYYARHLDPARDAAGLRRRHIEGRKILISGASSGIGRDLALLCAELGGHVLLVARRAALLAEVADQIRDAGGRADYYEADLADMDACDAVVQAIAREHGHVDILVNNAARSIRRPAEASLERFHDYERTMRLNFFAPLRLIRGCLPLMRERKAGHIVNVLTAGARMPSPNFSAYGASKAALAHFTDTLGTELLADGIHCTGVYLSWVRTPMMGDRFDDNRDVMTSRAAAEWIVDGVVHKQRSVMTASTRRRFVGAILTPMTMSRALNVLWRISNDEGGANPEFAADRMIAKRLFKGRLM